MGIKEYRSLPGKGLAGERSFAIAVREISRLYLGKDHLLRVNNNGYTENYRRFYFSDIQALVIGRTNRWKLWNIVWSILGSGCLIWLFSIELLGGRIALGIFAGLFLLFLAVNAFSGPTCKVRIYTRTGCEPLPSLRRLRHANKVLSRLKPLIQEVQGVVSDSQLSNPLAELGSVPLRKSLKKEPEITCYAGGVHAWLSSLFLVNAVLLSAKLLFPNVAPILFLATTLLLVLAMSGTTIMAIVKQTHSSMGELLRGVTWSSLGYSFIGIGIFYIFFTITVIDNPKKAQNTWFIFKKMASFPVTGLPLLITFASLALISAIFGITGWILLLSFRRKYKADSIEKPVES